MCGFSHIFLTPTGSRWVGVTPLRGRRSNGFPRDSCEAQGLRIGYKFMKIQRSPNPFFIMSEEIRDYPGISA
jgi:hypothetical protein